MSDRKKHIATCATPRGIGTHFFYALDEIDKYDELLRQHGYTMKRFRWRNEECRHAVENEKSSRIFSNGDTGRGYSAKNAMTKNARNAR
jgi:hypothetical protein